METGDVAAAGGAETAAAEENEQSNALSPAEEAEKARASQNASRLSAAHSERIVE